MNIFPRQIVQEKIPQFASSLFAKIIFPHRPEFGHTVSLHWQLKQTESTHCLCTVDHHWVVSSQQLLLPHISITLPFSGPSVVGLLSYQNLGSILTGAPVEGSDWEQIVKSKQETDKPNYKVLSKVASAFLGHNETTALSNSVTFSFNHPKPVSIHFFFVFPGSREWQQYILLLLL